MGIRRKNIYTTRVTQVFYMPAVGGDVIKSQPAINDQILQTENYDFVAAALNDIATGVFNCKSALDDVI